MLSYQNLSKPILQVIGFLICFLTIFSCHKKKLTPIELAEAINKSYLNHATLSSEITYQIKRFNSIKDTSKISVKVDLIRIPEDTILGGYVWISTDSIDRYYDTKYTYWISHQEKSITQFTPTKQNTFPFKGDFKEAINVYFLKPERLLDGATSDEVDVIIQDTFINQKKIWKWTYNFLNQEGFKKNEKNIWIQQDNYMIPKMNFLAIDYQNENQYNQWDLSNVSFDQVTLADLQKKFAKLKKQYTFDIYIPEPEPSYKPLANGSIAPNLNLEFYPEGQKGALADFKGNITLVDFWYMDCVPCIQAIPHLNELHQKYAIQGLKVLGINPFDNTEKNLSRFPYFLAHNKMDYPIIFTNQEEIQSFNIFGFPTVYLIDKKGKIVSSGLGGNEKIFHNLDSLVQTIL